MKQAKTKIGRPRKPHITSWGESINGLRRPENDGRWVLVETGEMFSQPDERLAIAHFRRWESKEKGNHTLLEIPNSSPESRRIIKRLGDYKSGSQRIIQSDGKISVVKASDIQTYSSQVPENLLFHWMKEQLINRPKYCAEQTGIEQLAYLADIPKPTPSPSLKNVGDLYFEKSKLSADWRSKCKSFWKEFSDSVEVKTLREVNQEHLLDYHDLIIDASKSPAHARQRFGAIKAIVNYPTKRGKWSYCQMSWMAPETQAAIFFTPSTN